ncbi:phage tail tube protein [Humibacter sp.]|uniref:phage tail tube protein n=1 Tax=Humibacter sp. TaxID=1940291 RepID=UPI003F7D21F6
MSKSLARRFKVQVSATGVDGTWLALSGINDLSPTENATQQSTDDYDTDGFNSFEKTMTGGKLVAKVTRPTTAGIPSDAGQELCRATRFQFQDAARVFVRWFDRYGADEAYSMEALVDWNPSKTGVADVEEVTITFTGDGVVSAIANPYQATAVPIITAATPSGAGTGALVTITGQGFLGTVATTGVKFGAVNATNWQVLSDSLIVATVPSGSAGAANIVVTNAVGASAQFAYTRAA